MVSVLSRDRLIARLATRLSHAEYPRTLMLALVGIASCVGFLITAGMLALGVASPWLRYPMAAVGGYAAFLVFVWMWLAWRRGDRHWDPHLDGAEHLGSVPDAIESAPAFGGGGGFSGGGSSASFGAPDHATAVVGHAAEVKSSVLEHALGAAGDADEGAVVLVPLVIVAAVLIGLGATVSVLYNAPALLAEVMLDGAIAAAVYRRVRMRSAEHWSYGVLRRTWKPMLAITVTLFGLGIAIPLLVPGADSIGDLFR